jgi:hypothetical protein
MARDATRPVDEANPARELSKAEPAKADRANDPDEPDELDTLNKELDELNKLKDVTTLRPQPAAAGSTAQ